MCSGFFYKYLHILLSEFINDVLLYIKARAKDSFNKI